MGYFSPPDPRVVVHPALGEDLLQHLARLGHALLARLGVLAAAEEENLVPAALGEEEPVGVAGV